MIEVREKFASRSVDAKRAELRYTISGTDDATAARDELISQSPTTLGLLTRSLADVRVTEEGDNLWTGIVPFRGSQSQPQQPGESSFSFDIASQQQRITQSLATRNKTPASGATAPDFKQAIAVEKDSQGNLNVQGTDIFVPTYAFSETHVLSAQSVDNAYKGTLFNIAGTVNNAAFKGLATGECLFTGAQGTQRDDGTWRITFQFQCLPNKSNLDVGGITVPEKFGWDFLWALYEDEVVSDELVRKPRAVYVERVYEAADFSALGIGT